MSADAKLWNTGSGWLWCGVHDAECAADSIPHDQGASLSETIISVERCAGQSLRWEFRTYPDGTIGLVGYYS